MFEKVTYRSTDDNPNFKALNNISFQALPTLEA